ncbi:MAG: hypothetical protein GYA41_09525 [Bacteroidales bacterium]|nr:hypothetical protein [Bacteroidales bacterium]
MYIVVKELSFGSITVNGVDYEKDIIIDAGCVKKRKKAESKKYRERFGHTPLSANENLPWQCKCLVIGNGHSSAMPVMEEVYYIALQKGVKLKVMSTPEAIKHINDPETNFVLHLTC